MTIYISDDLLHDIEKERFLCTLFPGVPAQNAISAHSSCKVWFISIISDLLTTALLETLWIPNWGYSQTNKPPSISAPVALWTYSKDLHYSHAGHIILRFKTSKLIPISEWPEPPLWRHERTAAWKYANHNNVAIEPQLILCDEDFKDGHFAKHSQQGF